MTSVILRVTGAKASAWVTGPLTSGMVGLPVTIEYDGAWEGLTKNLVCRCGQEGEAGTEVRSVLDVGESAAVAREVMKAGRHLYLGVEGFSSDGSLVIPTTWAMCGWIESGANTDADPSADPALPVWTRLQEQIDQLREGAVTAEQVAQIRDSVQAAVAAAQRAEAAADALKNASGGLSAAAAELLVSILRDCAAYSPLTSSIDMLEALLTQGEQPAAGVTQNGSVLTIISGVAVSQDGGTLNIT